MLKNCDLVAEKNYRLVILHTKLVPHYGCMQAAYNRMQHAYDRRRPACRRRRPAFYGVDAGMQIVIIHHE